MKCDRGSHCTCGGKIATKTLLLAALAAGCGARPLAGAQPQATKRAPSELVVLDSAATILVGSDEPSPIVEASRDLASDFEKVLGKKPRIVHREEDAAPGTVAIVSQSKLLQGMRPADLTAPESFSISVVQADWKPQPSSKVVLLAGADMRGTIFAIYQFSEEFLGIDPLYYWTDHEPVHHARIELPASLKEAFPSPVFKYRGFFINDEDLLTGWAPGEKKDHTGISLEVWNKIFETILRLKGNLAAPGTWIFPDDPQIALAGKRGLIVTQHHAIPLGLNVARWPKDVPYNYTTHPEILERAWSGAVRQYPRGLEVLWTVGLRGLSDVSYASMDSNVRGDNKALGHLISKAIADQMQIVRANHPDAEFITNLWQEGARLVQQGDLSIPSDVSTVWADDGYGYIQDKGAVTKGQGAYYHVAMMNFRANQLTELVPVERIFSEVGRYIKAGATHYLLVNTSDTRPVLLSIKAVMEVAWKGAPPGGAEASDEFIRRWASVEFGSKAASEVAEIYRDYFRAPARLGEPEREYGEQLYHTEARRLMLTYMIDSPLYAIPSQAPKWVQPRIFGFGAEYTEEAGKRLMNETAKREIEQCGSAQPRWDALWKKALAAEPRVDPARRSFYHAHVLAMIAINRESNRMLFEISKAIQEAQSGEMSQARQSATAALHTFDGIQQAETAAEYGKWKNWYRGDWLTGIYRTREMVEAFSKFLSDPLTPLPPPAFWDGWEAYYHIMHYEEDRSADVN
ncbi:MAG: glycosyl hydrolase 115 family protein [Acidobacteriia bacterium]|nr:glycosyl hydrolase 115 family protein [Terriglobia bacterium]